MHNNNKITKFMIKLDNGEPTIIAERLPVSNSKNFRIRFVNLKAFAYPNWVKVVTLPYLRNCDIRTLGQLRKHCEISPA